MAVDISVGTPLAEALNKEVHTKLLEVGWGTEDDTSLAEFIVLMLVNGKTEAQIAAELASDILPEGEGTQEFAQWLFQQVEKLRAANSNHPTEAPTEHHSIPSYPDADNSRPANEDHRESPSAYNPNLAGQAGQVPNTAPNRQQGSRSDIPSARGARMMGQMKRAMNRPNDSALHRVRPGSGTEKINSHTRDAPKGPRNVQNRNMRPGVQKGLSAMGVPTPGMVSHTNGTNMLNPTPQSQMPMPMSPQQQMEMMAMMEQSARMMAQFMPGMMGPGSGVGVQPGPGAQGKSLFDRVEAGPTKRGRGGRMQRNGVSRNKGAVEDNQQDVSMSNDDTSDNFAALTTSSLRLGEPSQPQNSDPAVTMCRFNLRCTNKACPFVHQSPAAPEGVTVDMNDACAFGAACKNSKCTGRHPSPGLIRAHQSEEQCKFFPYCTNASCPFKHPSMPMCRNGADCNVPHCKFTHLSTPCKYNPCKNVRCPYKHVEGQRGSYSDKVWTADSAKQEETDHHVSERKFVEDDGEEELIKAEDVAAQAAQLIA